MTKHEHELSQIKEQLYEIMEEAACDAGFFVDGETGIYAGEHGEIDITDELVKFTNNLIKNIIFMALAKTASEEKQH